METLECLHQEEERLSQYRGAVKKRCARCGQVVAYPPAGSTNAPILLELGRVDEKVVLPKEGYAVSLTSLKDKVDLATVQKGVPSPQPKDPRERLSWYRDHKVAMIRDLLELGPEAFLERWGVKRQMLSHLKTDPLYQEMAAKAPTVSATPKPRGRPRIKGPDAPEALPGAILPPLPEWRDTWWGCGNPG